MNVKFIDFENEVIKMILDNNIDKMDILREQYKISQVLKRKFTGCGFFSTFIINDTEKKLQFEELNIELSCLGEIEGVENGVGFILFIRDGYIDVLEGYTYGEETWPEEIGKYKLYLE
jgi:hypothetical protein